MKTKWNWIFLNIFFEIEYNTLAYVPWDKTLIMSNFYFDSETFSNSKVQIIPGVFIDDKLTCELRIRQLFKSC